MVAGVPACCSHCRLVAAQVALAGVLAATLLALLWLAYFYVLPLLSGAAAKGGRARSVQEL